MATLPADEDYARALICVFVERHMRVGQTLPEHEAHDRFVASGYGYDFDFHAAVDYALSQGWISRDLDRLRLKRAGLDES